MVRLARSVGALAVRGNHDDVATSAYNILLKGGRLNKPTLWGWVSDLTPEDAAYLDSLPFTISLPSLQVIVVHAGAIPELWSVSSLRAHCYACWVHLDPGLCALPFPAGLGCASLFHSKPGLCAAPSLQVIVMHAVGVSWHGLSARLGRFCACR